MKFISKYRNHKICMKPSWIENVQGTIIKHSAHIIEFDQSGVFDTKDKAEIEFLKKHSEYGFAIFEEKPEKEAKE